MKTGKRLLCMILAAVMTCSMGLAGNGTKAEAAVKASAAKYIRCGIGMKNYVSTTVYMPGKNDNIKNIKVYKGRKRTNNIVVKQTYRMKNTYKGAVYGSQTTLTMYAKKKGTYQVKFDVYKNKTSRRSSHVITVRANGNSNSALMKVTLNGRKIFDANKDKHLYGYYTTAKSGKVKFIMDEGCRITNITVHTCKKNSYVQTVKPFKNGRKITFGKYGSVSSSDVSWSKPMWAPTSFTIYYTDKNNGGEASSISFTIYRAAKN